MGNSSELVGIRVQILANAKILLKPITNIQQPLIGSQSTLIAPTNPYEGMDVVVFGAQAPTSGAPAEYVAALMMGLTPAIEGDKALNPEGAVRKLFLATCELLKAYLPKVLPHQRNIHGGGVFDEDMISPELIEAQRRLSAS